MLVVGLLVEGSLVSGGGEAAATAAELDTAEGNRLAAGFAGAVAVSLAASTAQVSLSTAAAGDATDISPGGGGAGPYTGELSRSVAGRGDSGGVRSAGPTFRRRLPAFERDSVSDRESALEWESDRESDSDPESESVSEP